nr:MAG TPA: hypothetical protein [Caudoviricetes sp.]
MRHTRIVLIYHVERKITANFLVLLLMLRNDELTFQLC